MLSNKEILEKIIHPNKKIIAEDILNGTSEEELLKKYDYYQLEEMKRQINKIKGNPWVCKTCQV